MVGFVRSFTRVLFISLCCFVVVSSCTYDEKGLADKLDRDTNMSGVEYKKVLTPPDSHTELDKKNAEKAAKTPAIPEMSEILTTPPAPTPGNKKLVSISVTEDVSLKDVLVEIGRTADIDMEVDPSISGGIILRVKDKPFDQVLDRVAELGGLRYEYKDNVLRVQKDTPYIHNYSLDFLNITRSSTSNVSINTQVLGGSGGSSGSTSGSGGSSNGGSTGSTSSGSTGSTGGTSSSSSSGSGGSLSSGSSSSITSSYDGDLWSSIDKGVTSILAFSPKSLSSENQTAVPGVVATAGANANGSSFTINKQAGIISVLATSRQHKNIKEYLDKIKASVSSQVLIEAKIVEVTLNNEYRTGINWGSAAAPLFLNGGNVGLNGAFTNALSEADGSASEAIKFSIFNDKHTTLDAAVSMVEKYGTSRTLSSPRINAMNNQQAVLTFAENNVYFTVQVQEQTQQSLTTTGNQSSTLTVQSTLNTVPIGVILTLQPSIDEENQEITMNIRPTLSRITGTVSDPGVAISAEHAGVSNVSSQIPIVEVREIDSILKIKSGQVMVIGGLMEEINSNNDAGIPFLSRIPFIGNAAKSVAKTNSVVETVIFIKATILDGQRVGDQDQKVYKTFTHDPRPLAF